MTVQSYTWEWATPYEVVDRGRFQYDVVFEETTILMSCGNHYDASKFAAMLNGAYNLGRSSGYLTATCETNRQLNELKEATDDGYSTPRIC